MNPYFNKILMQNKWQKSKKQGPTRSVSDEVCDVFVDQVPQCVFTQLRPAHCIQFTCFLYSPQFVWFYSEARTVVKATSLWEIMGSFTHTPLWNVLNILTAAVCTNVKSHSICIVILCVIIYKRCQTRLHRWKRATFTSWFKVVTRHVSCLWELVLNSQCDLVFKSPHASDILYD